MKKTHKFTENQREAMIKDYESGQTIPEVMEKYNISESGLRYLLSKNGIKSTRVMPEINDLTLEEAAYIAGFVDGEGRIGIDVKRPENSNGCRRDSFIVGLRITNTNLEVLNWIYNKIGLGSVIENVNNNAPDHHKAVNEYRLSSNQTTLLLECILPFLIVKKEQAKTALKFIALRQEQGYYGRRGLPDEKWQKQADLYERMKLLNKKGP